MEPRLVVPRLFESDFEIPARLLGGGTQGELALLRLPRLLRRDP